MRQLYFVLKPVSATGGSIPPGTVVDAGTWRNVDRLVAQRYLRLATDAEAARVEIPAAPGSGQPKATARAGRPQKGAE